jgi:hypothetical protein
MIYASYRAGRGFITINISHNAKTKRGFQPVKAIPHLENAISKHYREAVDKGNSSFNVKINTPDNAYMIGLSMNIAQFGRGMGISSINVDIG